MADEMEPIGMDQGDDETTSERDTQVPIAWVGHQGDRAHVRILERSDWESVGVDHDRVEWDTNDRLRKGQAWVSPEAADYLLEVEPGFEKVEKENLSFGMRQGKI
jgi:hypothetical protein